MQERLSYPPKGFQREEIEYHGPKTHQIECFVRRAGGGELKEDSLWLLTPQRRVYLATPVLIADNPFALSRVALAPNLDFILGARKVSSGESDLFLWVRQKDGAYKLLPESVAQWIKRRRGYPKGREELNFIRLIEWRAGGNGVILACQFDFDKRAPWQRLEIDLVRGKFGAFTPLPANWKSLI